VSASGAGPCPSVTASRGADVVRAGQAQHEVAARSAGTSRGRATDDDAQLASYSRRCTSVGSISPSFLRAGDRSCGLEEQPGRTARACPSTIFLNRRSCCTAQMIVRGSMGKAKPAPPGLRKNLPGPPFPPGSSCTHIPTPRNAAALRQAKSSERTHGFSYSWRAAMPHAPTDGGATRCGPARSVDDSAAEATHGSRTMCLRLHARGRKGGLADGLDMS